MNDLGNIDMIFNFEDDDEESSEAPLYNELPEYAITTLNVIHYELTISNRNTLRKAMRKRYFERIRPANTLKTIRCSLGKDILLHKIAKFLC